MSQTYTLYSDASAPKTAALTATPAERTITVRGRNPSWVAVVNIPLTSFPSLADVPTQYRALLDAVIETAAKAILTRRIGTMSIKPASIEASLFTPDTIMSEATATNSDWLTKEELTAHWQQSHTRTLLVNDPRYQQSSQYRAAVSYFADLVTKLSGKTSQFKPEELDSIMAKLSPADLDTELGQFIVRRIEAIKNKPVAVQVDLLAML
jgi:hypothetical protein